MLRIRPEKNRGTDNDPFGDGSYIRTNEGHWAIGPRDDDGTPTPRYIGELDGITDVIRIRDRIAPEFTKLESESIFRSLGARMLIFFRERQ